MAITKADAVIVSAGVLTGFAKRNRIAALTNQSFTGEVLGKGSTVKVRSLADVTLSNYTPGTTVINPEALTDAETLLVLDQAKYFAFLVDDVDASQGAGEYLAAAAARAGEQAAEAIDAYIAGIIAAQAGIDMTTADLSANGAAYEYLVSLRTALADTSDSMSVVVPSAFVGALLLGPRFVGVGNSAVAQNGIVGRAAGFTVVESNVLSGATETVIAMSDSAAVASAVSINKTERYRPESSFSEAVKGLAVFGAKVLKPSAVAAGVVTF